MSKLLKEICNLRGVSGDESRVAAFVQEQIGDGCDIKVDPLGSVIVNTKLGKKPKLKVGLFAHTDEVGFIVTQITKDGFIKFQPIGVAPDVTHGRGVLIGDNAIKGVIGAKALHHVEPAERDKPIKPDSMVISIGAKSKEEAEKLVSLGDFVTFDEPYMEFGSGKVMSKALDDRAGCAIMLDVLKSELPADITCVFTTMEEVGLVGATAAAYSVDVDVAIVLECTTAGDVGGSNPSNQVCAVDKGVVVSYMDRGAIYDTELYNLAFKLGKEQGIPVQTKEGIFGGNDSGAIKRSKGGVRVMALSLPCRYLHSSSGVISLADYEASKRLVMALLNELC